MASCEPTSDPISVIGEESASIQAVRELKSDYELNSSNAVEVLGYTFEESFERVNVDFASQAGRYDIVMQYNFSLSSFVRNNYVYSLDELKAGTSDLSTEFESDIFPNVWEEVGYYYTNPQSPREGIAAVGYPFAANTMLLAYNRHMFEDQENKQRYFDLYGEELLPPTTWQKFEQIARFFTDPTRDTFGIAMHGSAGGWLYYEWTNYVFGAGGGVSQKLRGWEGDETIPITLYTAENVAATQMFVNMRQYNKGSFFDVDGTLQAELMKEGNVAMALMWVDYLYPAFADPQGKFGDQFGFAPIPGDKSMLAGGAYFINRDSNKANEAFRFVLWLMQKENQIKMLKNGLASPLRSVYKDPQVQDIPYIEALEASLERGVYFIEAGPDSDFIGQVVSEYVQKAWRGEMTVDQALAQAQQMIDNERPDIFSAIN